MEGEQPALSESANNSPENDMGKMNKYPLHSRVHSIHSLHSNPAIGEEDSNVSKLVEMSEESTSSLVPMETLTNHRHNGAMGGYNSSTPSAPEAQEGGVEEDEPLSTEDDS